MTQTARLYGSSLYELAAEEQLTDVLMEQMEEVRQLFRENPEYVKLLGEPSIPGEKREELLEQAFGGQAQRYLVNFLKEFRRRYNEDHNIAEALVTSAVALSETQMEALKARLEKISGKQVLLTQKTDPKVVAGLRVELEGRQLDGTVQGRLSEMSKKLNEVIV